MNRGSARAYNIWNMVPCFYTYEEYSLNGDKPGVYLSVGIRVPT